MYWGTRIYNSRNYSILLNILKLTESFLSTTVEIILYYLTLQTTFRRVIYNSRNYSILLNRHRNKEQTQSTTVEIILYYLTTPDTADGENLQQ